MGKAIGKQGEVFRNEEEILLGLLTAIEQNAGTSQRTISRDLNVALGLANAYLKRGVRKGLIKIKQVPRRRYMYYLTPRGFAEKSRLTGRYFAASFTFFRRARTQMGDLIGACSARGWKRILFAGVSEMAEVGALCALEHPVQIVGILDAETNLKTFCGLPIFSSLPPITDFDVVIITTINEPQAAIKSITEHVIPDRLLAPNMLGVDAVLLANISEAAE